MSTDFPNVSYAPRNTGRGWQTPVIVTVISLGIVLAGTAVYSFFHLPPGTTVLGRGVSTEEEAVSTVDRINNEMQSLPVTLQTSAGETSITGEQLGLHLLAPDLGSVAEHQTGIAPWFRRFFGGGRVVLPVTVTVDAEQLPQIAEAASTAPVDGNLEISADDVVIIAPSMGVAVSQQDAADAVNEALQSLATIPFDSWPDPIVLTVSGEETSPTVGQDAVDTAVQRLEAVTASEVTLTARITSDDAKTVDGVGVLQREDATFLITGSDLRSMITTSVAPDAAPQDRLRLTATRESLSPDFAHFIEQAATLPEVAASVQNRSAPPGRGGEGTPNGGPADQIRLADVSTVTGDVVFEVLAPGLRPNIDATIQAVIDAAVAGQPTAAVQGEPVNEMVPADYGILEPVSTYTTFYDPGQSRATNIHRIAAIVDGALIPPGGNFEVNHAAGERTSAGGFVSAGAIYRGELVSDVGGGVSQFATTFFNAMWYSGVDIITHTPHSYWFSRYPAGREATIDYPGVNLELNNNTPYWILVDTHVTGDSVTVTFWSTKYFEVTEVIGDHVPVAGQDFAIAIERRAIAPALPEYGLPEIIDDDRFTHTYGQH